MNNAYKKWLPYIEADLTAALTLYKNAVRTQKTNWHHWAPVIWHAHQVVEKSLKAIMTAKDIELLKIHDLPRLVELAQIGSEVARWKNLIIELNEYYILPRYPDLPLKKSYPRSTKTQAKKFVDFSKQFLLWTKEYLSRQT